MFKRSSALYCGMLAFNLSGRSDAYPILMDIVLLQSLKSRGIRFPGRDEESLAPIFTPPQSVQTSNTAGSGGFDGSVHSRDMSGFVAHDVSSTDFKEVFDVARNSVELLNTVLTSSPQQEVLKVRV